MAMEHLLEAYASSSDDNESVEKVPPTSALGELPPEILGIFHDNGETETSHRRFVASWLRLKHWCLLVISRLGY